MSFQKIIGSLCILLFVCVSPAKAQTTESPYSEVKGNIVISAFHTLDKSYPAESIFLNALLWMIENREEEPADTEEGKNTLEVDYDKQQYAAALIQRNPRNASSRYRCLFSVKVADNIITILASDIISENEIGVVKLVKKLPFEKLQPEKKPKHKELLNEFAKLHRETVEQMLEAITTRPAPVVTHWTEIKNKDVVKGMNKQECLLAFGKPASIQKQGNKEEWMYDSYTYVFFENGIVSSLIK